MSSRFAFAMALLAFNLLGPSLSADELPPPVAPIKPFELKEHGHVRVDNYYWMRERDNPQALDYLKAENAYTDAVMAATKPLEEKLYRDTIARIKQDDTTVPYLENGYEYQTRFVEGREYPIYCRRLPRDGAAEEVLVDVNKFAEEHAFCSVPGVTVNRRNDLAAKNSC